MADSRPDDTASGTPFAAASLVPDMVALTDDLATCTGQDAQDPPREARPVALEAETESCSDSGGRGAAANAIFGQTPGSLTPSTPAPACTRAATAKAAPALEAALTADLLAERAAKLFVLDATGPAATGMVPVIGGASNLLIRLACKVSDDLCKERRPALSRAYGNFDKVVALGWLLGDALGLPLMERDNAFEIGSAARKRLLKFESEITSAKKAASRATAKAPDEDARRAIGEAAAETQAEVLRRAVDPPLPLPNALPSGGAKRKRAAGPSLAQLRQAVRAAEAAEATAEATYDADVARVGRAERRLKAVENQTRPDFEAWMAEQPGAASKSEADTQAHFDAMFEQYHAPCTAAQAVCRAAQDERLGSLEAWNEAREAVSRARAELRDAEHAAEEVREQQLEQADQRQRADASAAFQRYTNEWRAQRDSARRERDAWRQQAIALASKLARVPETSHPKVLDGTPELRDFMRFWREVEPELWREPQPEEMEDYEAWTLLDTVQDSD